MSHPSFREFLTERAESATIVEAGATGGYKNVDTRAFANFLDNIPNREPYKELLAKIRAGIRANKPADIEKAMNDTIVSARSKQTATGKLNDYLHGIQGVTADQEINFKKIDWDALDTAPDHLDR